MDVAVPSVNAFQAAYEAAVPDVPTDEVHALLARGAPWSAMVELIDGRAPNGFLIYRRNDVHPVMTSAGDPAACITYLMGNHVIAEQHVPLCHVAAASQPLPDSEDL